MNVAPVKKYSTETNFLDDALSSGSEALVYRLLHDVCVSAQGRVGLIFYRVNEVMERRGKKKKKSLAKRFQLSPWVCASNL